VTNYEITGLSAIASASVLPAVILPVVDPNDTSTPPAGAGGSNKQMTLSQLLPGYVWPSGDTTGAKDAAAISAAVSALPSGGGAITLLPGEWHLVPGAVTISVAKPVWILAWGATFNAVGTSAGPLFNIYDSSSIIPRNYSGGGFLGGTFLINGTNGSYALRVGDIFQWQIDVRVFNSAGTAAKGVWFDNRYYWTEELRGVIYTEGCEVVYDNSAGSAGTATGSFDRNSIIHNINNAIGGASPGVCNGVVLQGGAGIGDAAGMIIQGNMLTAASQYAVLLITGSNSDGYSAMFQGTVSFGVELDDNAHTAPYTIQFGSTSNQWFNGSGAMDFAGTSYSFTASNKNGNFSFYGLIMGDAVLASATNNWATSFNFQGGIALGDYNTPQTIASNGTISPTGPGYWPVTNSGAVTGVILATGAYSGQLLAVGNEGSGQITFAAKATSNVAAGVLATIAANSSRTFYWDTNTSLWY